MPAYQPLAVPTAQADAIAQQLAGYRVRLGLLRRFEEVVANLTPNVSAGQFEQALADLAEFLGVASARHDRRGEGPDVLWLFPGNVGFVIEAKSRKQAKNALTKDQHGQLLVAEQWFGQEYSGFRCIRVSVQATNRATPAAAARESYALTFEKLAALVSDLRVLLSDLCESQLTAADLVAHCNRQLVNSPLRTDAILANYFVHFQDQ